MRKAILLILTLMTTVLALYFYSATKRNREDSGVIKNPNESVAAPERKEGISAEMKKVTDPETSSRNPGQEEKKEQDGKSEEKEEDKYFAPIAREPLMVKVVDQKGNPILGANVTIWYRNKNLSEDSRRYKYVHGETDNKGFVHLNPRLDTLITMLVKRDGYVRRFYDLDLADREGENAVVIALEKGGVVEGKVVGVDPKHLVRDYRGDVGVVVRIDARDFDPSKDQPGIWIGESIDVKDDLTFSYKQAPLKPLKITAYHIRNNFYKEATLDAMPDSGLVTITLERAGESGEITLTFPKITDKPHDFLLDFYFSFYKNDPQDHPTESRKCWTSVVGQDLTHEIELEKGRYTAYIISNKPVGGKYYYARQTVEVQKHTKQNYNVELKEAETAEIKLVDRGDGTPLTGQIRYFGEDVCWKDQLWTYVESEKGMVANFRTIPPGAWLLEVEAQGNTHEYKATKVSIDVLAGETTKRTIEMERR